MLAYLNIDPARFAFVIFEVRWKRRWVFQTSIDLLIPPDVFRRRGLGGRVALPCTVVQEAVYTGTQNDSTHAYCT